MTLLSFNPLRRWWQAAFAPDTPAFVPTLSALSIRRPPPRPTAGRGRRSAAPFTAYPAGRPVDNARCAARRFWMTLDPQDRRRAAIGGSFAEVCAALERLAALEEGRTR